jgi:hypothetical protein
MKTITLKLYSFNQLDKDAKQKALTTYQDLNIGFDWWDDEFEDFIELCSYLGIAVSKDSIKFRGFYSQGDGSSFSAMVDIPKLVTAIANQSWKDYAPQQEFVFIVPQIDRRVMALVAGGLLPSEPQIIGRSRRIRIYRLSGWAVAASVLFVVGLYFYHRPKENSTVVTAKDPIVVPKFNEETNGSPAKRAAVIRYSKKAVLIAKNETPDILSLLSNELSSGTRISGLQKAGKLSAITPALMETIVQRATQDPNSNVRLAAIQVIVSRLNQPDIAVRVLRCTSRVCRRYWRRSSLHRMTLLSKRN